MIALVLNPRSRENRLHPELRERFARQIDGVGTVLAPSSLAELEATARELGRVRPSVIAIHGGDGSLHQVLTAVIGAFEEAAAPLPPVAFLGGGTMNVVRSSLNLRKTAEPFVDDLVAAAARGVALPTIPRRCVRVGRRHGFIFGNGLVANFLDAYYEGGNSGQGRAAWILGRTLGSALIGGPFADRVFRHFHGRVTVDGQVLDRHDFVAIIAATVTEVGFGMKLNPRADDDPDRMSVLLLNAHALALALDAPAVRLGHGVAPDHGRSLLASRLELEPDEGASVFTMDGDMYRQDGPLVVQMGPRLAVIQPGP